jgi:protein-disulfide isomerase
MENRKTIILGFIALVVLVGVVWYANQTKQQTDNQTGSVSENSSQGESSLVLIDELILGNPEAPVTMIEYSSHFCGHCVNFHKQTLPLIMDKYIKTGKVKLISRFLSPVEFGMAIFCAQEQDKFSEFSEYLFEHARELKSTDELRAVASNLDLNQDDFDQCYDSQRYQDKVKGWFDQASQTEVKGTPTFFINNQQIIGNQPYSVFEEIIEQALVP